jgi:SsrA-binding protein
MAKRAPGTITLNRRARRDYEVIETVEAGIALLGSEVKALRAGRVQLADAFARVRNGEMWLEGVHISPYEHSTGQTGHDPERSRKLLLHRPQIERWASRVQQERLAIIPLDLHFRDGRAKVELALARGRRAVDKRETLKRREADLEAQRAMARARRR